MGGVPDGIMFFSRSHDGWGGCLLGWLYFKLNPPVISMCNDGWGGTWVADGQHLLFTSHDGWGGGSVGWQRAACTLQLTRWVVWLMGQHLFFQVS
jgi:hypothetical protein